MGLECSTARGGTKGTTVRRRKVVYSKRGGGQETQQHAESERHHDIFNKSGTALHIAAAQGNEKEVQHCIKQGAGLNSLDEEGRTPFMMACKYGKLGTAHGLIKLGANPDLKDKQKLTAKDLSMHKHVNEWLDRYLRTRKLSETAEFYNYQDSNHTN
eukprot:703824-Rhodomonas_salina.1